ncbi:hypothetical protein SJ059_28710, partial [Klebsiella aerogenes]|nr:hypothetical protein [Klebsiella aerogenes]
IRGGESAETFPAPDELLPGGLYVQPGQQVFLHLQMVQFVGHRLSLFTLSGHATAHPFHVFQGTDCSGLWCSDRITGPCLLCDGLPGFRVNG